MPIWFFFCFAQLDPDAQNRLLNALESLQHFQVNFVQETYSDFLDDTVASGELIISRPGRMRMTYHKGDRKIIIWDGKTAYEKDLLADTESRREIKELRGEPLVQILLYGSNLLEHFLIDRIQADNPDVFRLRPRQPDNYEVHLQLDSQNRPSILEVVGEDGEGTRFHFTDLRMKPELKADTFSIPEIVE